MVARRTFDGKVAVVTGAGSGLGRAHATELARRGATVVLNDIRLENDAGDGQNRSTADAVAASMVAEGWKAEADTGDVGDEVYATGLIERAIDRHGRIDILINNAGISGTESIDNCTTADLTRIFNVNYWAAVWTMRAAVPVMRKFDFGRIVNTSSGVGAFGSPNRIGYASSKAALIGLTRAAALDVDGSNIRINAICPIAITPMSRDILLAARDVDEEQLDPRRVTAVALFLGHEDCQLNGIVLSAGMGTWARIFIAKTNGHPTSSIDLDDVPGNLNAILDTAEFHAYSRSGEQYTTVGIA